MALRLSVSDVDAYRYWRDNDLPLENLRARLMRLESPSPQMLVGTLLHKVLECEQDGELHEIEGDDGTVLRFELDAEIALPEIREQFVRRVYTIDGREVEVRGKVDAQHGLTIEDHKTTGRFDAEALEALMDSMQWRLYLSATGAQRFRWNVFTVAAPLKATPNVWRVQGLDHVEQWRYPEMEADCVAAIGEFLGVVSRAVPEYFQPRQAVAA